MRGQSPHHTEPHLDQLRFLRYRQEVIANWRASDEKRIRLEAIQVRMESLAAISASRSLRPRTPGDDAA